MCVFYWRTVTEDSVCVFRRTVAASVVGTKIGGFVAGMPYRLVVSRTA